MITLVNSKVILARLCVLVCAGTLLLSSLVRCDGYEDESTVIDQDFSSIPVTEGFGGTVTIPKEGEVLVLNEDNFDHVVLPRDFILVEFYAPWCGHCQKLAPEYAKAAQILSLKNIPLAKLDANEHKGLADRFNVGSFPTLLMFRKGKHENYDGPRDAEGIADYVIERADPNWKPPPSNVLVLTAENFTDTINSKNIILVEFYAPWCGHCKALAPEYERAATQLKDFRVALAKVDGTAEKELAEKFDIHGWPTLVIFRKGQKFEYNGPRNAPGIVAYMKEQATPPSKEMTTVAQIENSRSKIDTAVIGFFDSDQDSLFKEYIAAGYELRENRYRLIHTFEPQVAKKYGVKPGTISVFLPEIFLSKYEPERRDYTEVTGKAVDIKKFVENKSVPLVGQRTRNNMQTTYNHRPLVVVYYEIDFSHQYRKATQIVRQKVVEAANDFPYVRFAISQELEFEDELKKLGLDESGEDINVGMFGKHGEKYAMEPSEEFNSKVLSKFVENVLNKKVKAIIMSEPIPKDNDGPVKIVVADSYNDLVAENPRDVLLEIYAPWCGHCRALEPVFNKLGKHFADNNNILIAKMDGTANDVPPALEVSGFPSIFFLPKDKKDSPISFDEKERSFENLSAFIEKHSSLPSGKDEL